MEATTLQTEPQPLHKVHTVHHSFLNQLKDSRTFSVPLHAINILA